MRNLAVLAVLLGALGSVANAESAVNSAPNFAVAIQPAVGISAPAVNSESSAVASKVEQSAVDRAMESVANKLNREFADRINQELEYAMQ